MSYTALYRKYRPTTFTDVKGQDHIITTLQNQIKSKRIGHAYLMCGTRGTGKTTVAKVLAKAVNCEAQVEGNPCGMCHSCISIGEGTSLNVIEIDAASNNGVDNIREIREEVAYRPTEGNYKVYIIDEVHMLSIGAFNALLKTLEEPPSYVIFILATTEKHKVPITILSRCQQYDFRRMSIEIIANRLNELMLDEGLKAEEKAIFYIAKVADGSMRDALSLLDQCIAFYFGETLTYENVLQALGAVDVEVFSRLLRSILQKDVAKVVKTIDQIVIEGSELSQFVLDFTWYLRNLLLLKTSVKMKGKSSCHQIEDVLNVTKENMKKLREESEQIDVETLLRLIRISSELSGQLKLAIQKRVVLEVAFIKLCIPAMEESVDSLIERIKTLEEKVESGLVIDAGLSTKEEISKEETSKKEISKERTIKEEISRERVQQEESSSLEKIATQFPKLIKEAKAPLKTYFLDTNKYRVSKGENKTLKLIHSNEFAYKFLSKPDTKEDLENFIYTHTNTKVEVEIIFQDVTKYHSDKKAKSIENMQKMINFPITQEDTKE